MLEELYFGGQTNDPEIVRENFGKVRDALLELQGYTTVAPDGTSLQIPYSEHGIKNIYGVNVYSPVGKQVLADVEIDFSTNDVTISACINLLNYKIKIF